MDTVPLPLANSDEKYLDENAEQFLPNPLAARVCDNEDDFRTKLSALGREQGFVRIGVTPAVPFVEAGQRFKDWISRGQAGSMDYLAEFGGRHDPGRLLANARSIVVAAAAVPRMAHAAESPSCGTVADYALGLDYHIALRSRLRRIGQGLADYSGRAVWARACIDTAPLLEREAARRAGIGFIAKSTMLIVPGVGPRVLLAALVTDLELWQNAPEKARCGRCNACLDACPTQALVAPYQLDARRCLSYLNIEHQGTFPREWRKLLGTRLIGCDICQAVCPHDRVDSAQVVPTDMTPRAVRSHPRLQDWLTMTASDYRRITKRSALRRVGRIQLMRNAAIAIGNARDVSAVAPLLHALGTNRSGVVRSHAAWALGQLGTAQARDGLQLAAMTEPDPVVQEEIQAALDEST